jgi:hypothetical protein
MSDEGKIEKLPPYQRLQNLFSEGEEPVLTDKANDNINKLLGLEEKERTPSIWDKIKKFFSTIDGKIFAKNSKISSRYQKR